MDVLQGVPKIMTALKFIYNWTKIKEGFEKNKNKTRQLQPESHTALKGRSASCFV